jgi:cellobiose-specific phosphotransferase system component IIA
VKLAKAMDHLERAHREEEAPLVTQAAQARIVSELVLLLHTQRT